MTIETEFNLDDKVTILALNTPGRVVSIWVAQNSIQYEVRYFYAGKADKIYFYPDELEHERKR